MKRTGSLYKRIAEWDNLLTESLYLCYTLAMPETTNNRMYKDSVFVDLFSSDETAKDNFLSLYNALHHTQLTSTECLTNLRLDQVLYMSFYNDVSYLVENKIIILAEHQSSINPNMPLRCLEYITRLYEQLFESKEKYSRKQLLMPAPEFYVFYNGQAPFEKEAALKLSEAFIGKPDSPSLELEVKVININHTEKHPVLEECNPMKEYSLFVETVRRHKKADTVNGFRKAIEECIKKDILREYLKRKTKEVINMLLTEYNYETDIAVQRAESFEQGLERGKSQGLAEGIEQGLAEGLKRGLEQGFSNGIIQTAKNLLEMGFAIDAIIKATGLTSDDVKKL